MGSIPSGTRFHRSSMGSATWLGLFLRTCVDRLRGDRRRRLFHGGRLGLLDRFDVDGPTLRADVHGLASSAAGAVLHPTYERGGPDKRSPILTPVYIPLGTAPSPRSAIEGGS